MLNKNQKEIINSIVKEYNLDLVLLFGSRARKQEREDSDWDLAIYSKKEINTDKYFEIISKIEGNCFKKIDLIIINEDIDPLLSKNIFEKPIILFEKNKEIFNELQINSIYKFIDYSPLYKIEEEIVKKRLEAL